MQKQYQTTATIRTFVSTHQRAPISMTTGNYANFMLKATKKINKSGKKIWKINCKNNDWVHAFIFFFDFDFNLNFFFCSSVFYCFTCSAATEDPHVKLTQTSHFRLNKSHRNFFEKQEKKSREILFTTQIWRSAGGCQRHCEVVLSRTWAAAQCESTGRMNDSSRRSAVRERQCILHGSMIFWQLN